MSDQNSATGALSGLLVADFSRVLAGPLATQTLADLGARVVKVERPETGDDTRAWGPPWTGNSSSYFHSANRGKESVTLDLAVTGDRALARELARRADVLVENFKPGTLDRYGLGYDQVRESNPGVIYCSITGFGSGGGAELAGYDFLVQAVSGLMSITGEAAETGGVPTKVGVALVDVLTSKDAVTAILAALHARQNFGTGQHVAVNLLSSVLAALVNQASSYLTTGTAPGRMGNAHPSIAPYELLLCADGPVAVACGNDRQFRKLSAVVGDSAMADDPRFTTNAARVSNRLELVKTLESLLAADSAAVWAERLNAAGVPAGTVGSIADGFSMAADLGLDPLISVGDDVPRQVRSPLTLSATPVTRYEAPPRLGQHDDQIRRWLEMEKL